MQNPTPDLTLGQKQELFATLVPRLLDHIHSLGYQTRLGDLFRDPRVFGAVGETKGYGHAKSAHKNKLALDVNLFLDGVFLQDSESHAVFGAYWESLHPLCRWGGRFNDGNHYSLEHNGVR